MNTVIVVGGGLAGTEAAWALAGRGFNVILKEMKPLKKSPAHKSDMLAELVCSNSLKAERLGSAAGLLKAEMSLLGSLCTECAELTRVPAGGALAVDRDKFSRLVTEKIRSHPLIKIESCEVTDIPQGNVIIAAGPLASEPLAQKIKELCGGSLSFFDAAAPIVSAESVDMGSAFTQSRYDRGGEDDYINCPMNKAEYEAFYEALINAESVVLHDFEKKNGVYEGCMPIEIMAKRGDNTIRFGPMKPVGLVDPTTGHRPWAVLQLRRENDAGTLLNLVGFQTNLKFPEQKRVFGMIPALKNAEYVRYGVMHRNSFIDAPRVLTERFNLKKEPRIFFAGQITGVEGYMESAASGIIAGINAARFIKGENGFVPPADTMLGAFCRYVSDESLKNYQPMGAAIGLLPPPEERIRDKRERYGYIAERALRSLEKYIKENEKDV